MVEKFEQSMEKQSSQSKEHKTVHYILQKLDFKRQEIQDKKEADDILKKITGENTQQGSNINHSKQRINPDKLRNMPRGKVDGNILGSAQNIMDRHNIQRHEDEYLAQHESMNENEYNRLFSGKEGLQQGQLGDCYLVSGINELAKTQHFDTLMRTGFKRVKRGNGDLGYQIKIPLGEPSGRKVLIKDSELKVAKIKGSDGYKFLELAYAKNKLRKNNRRGNTYAPITSSELKKIEGGWTHEVLKTFLGKNNIGFNDFGTMKNYHMGKSLSNSSKRARQEINNFLKHYDPNIGNKFISLASLPGSSDGKSYTVGGKTLYRRHAYSITGIKKERGEMKITVLNPWNIGGAGKNQQDFTIDEFFQAFSAIGCGTINRQTFLDNKSVS